jgi:phosphoglycolate phosphatase
MRRLLLFDIDGTLLSAGGAGARALLGAMREVYGQSGAAEGVRMGGRTDPEIVHTLLSGAGMERAEVEAGLDLLWERYPARLAEEVARGGVRALPGVPALLERVEARGGETVLGLLTGNVEAGARIKLEAAGLAFDRFRVGAFGSDHWRRDRLPEVAAARAEARIGVRYRGKEIVIVGDTPFDISCGAHLGVRTVATATGTHSPDELAACAPDYLFDDLSEVEAVWRAFAE